MMKKICYKKAKAAVTTAANAPFVFDQVDVPEPGPGQLGVKITATGLCHTDLTGLHGAIGMFPLVLGHEGAGIVEAVGEGVSDFKVGDRVAITYSSCGECDACKSGKSNRCERFMEMNFLGKSPLRYNGTDVFNWFGQNSFSNHTVVSENNLVHVPDGLDLNTAGPYGCGLITGAGSMFSLEPKESDTAAVFGLGAVGFAAVMAAKIAGCQTIIAVGGTPWKLELAKELGATHVINRRETPDIAAEIRKISPRGADVMVEATGHASMVQQALNSFAQGGRITMAAVYSEPISISSAAQNFNPTIKLLLEGDWNNRQAVETLMNYAVEGKFPVEKLIRYYKFEELQQAIEDLENQKVIKAVLLMDEA